MNYLRKLAHIAQVLDENGLHVQADSLTSVMHSLQTRIMRTAQMDSDAFGGGGLTFEKITQGVPGANFLTDNLIASAFGAQQGFNQVPGGTYFQGRGPENPLTSETSWNFNLSGLTSKQILELKRREFMRNSEQMIPRLVPYLQQVKDFYYKNPTMSSQEKINLVSGIIKQATSFNMNQDSVLKAFDQYWPDMPAEIKQDLKQQSSLMQQINALSEPYTGNMPSTIPPF